MDPEVAAAEARDLEAAAVKHAEGAFSRCLDLLKADDELITRSREMLNLTRQRLSALRL